MEGNFPPQYLQKTRILMPCHMDAVTSRLVMETEDLLPESNIYVREIEICSKDPINNSQHIKMW